MMRCNAINEAGQREGAQGGSCSADAPGPRTAVPPDCRPPGLPDLTRRWDPNQDAALPRGYITFREGRLRSSLENTQAFWFQGGRGVLTLPLCSLCLKGFGLLGPGTRPPKFLSLTTHPTEPSRTPFRIPRPNFHVLASHTQYKLTATLLNCSHFSLKCPL